MTETALHRVFGIINPQHFERLFAQWANNLKNSGILDKVVAIDGKTVRGSKDSFHDKSPIHLVHAWSVAHNLCLGQFKIADKSNEITAIPKLLEMIEIGGSIVTTDAMGTQTAISEKIMWKTRCIGRCIWSSGKTDSASATSGLPRILLLSGRSPSIC